MPAYVNHVVLGGYLGKDPIFKETKTGSSMLRFSIATTEKGKGDSDITYWHQIVAWGYMADWAKDHLKKGVYATVVGALRPRRFRNDKGDWVTTNDIWAMTISTASKEAAVEQTEMAATSSEDDDLPF